MRQQPTKAEAAPDFFSDQVSQASRFYLDLKPSPRATLTVVCGGLENCAADYKVSRKNFPFYSVEYVIRGSGTLTLNRRKLKLKPGMIFSYGPGVPHEIINDSARPMSKYFIDFSGTNAAKLMGSADLKPGSAAMVFPPGEIQPLFDEMIRNGRQGSHGAPEICRRLLEGTLLKIRYARAPVSSRDDLAFETYQHCREHLQRHFLRLRSVAQVAEECHVDDAYLCRLFKRFDHQSPYRCLMRLKMTHAAELLHKPGALVKQVAEDAGYANQFHFSRVFKSVFGVSPTEMVRMR